MKCIHLDRKVDEKVFHFLFAHVFSIPELLERLVSEKFPGFLTRYDHRILLNNQQVDVEISFLYGYAIFSEFKTNYWDIAKAYRQFENYNL
jgi:hypothetical protein